MQDLQQLDPYHSRYEVFPNSLISKEPHFVKELKLAYKWANILDERGDSNIEEDDESI